MKPLSLLLLFLPLGLLAQTSTQNYIKTTTYQVATRDGVDAVSGATLTTNEQMVNITYYDGLGRPKQQVAKRRAPNQKDLITPITYDEYGRQNKDYLPYPKWGYGTYQTSAVSDLESYYNTPEFDDTENPYTERIYEDSPLNRVLEVGAPGNKWQANPTSDTDRTIKTDYDANSWDDFVRWFAVDFENDNTQQPTLVDRGVYPAGELYKTTTKNENWRHYTYSQDSNKTETYTNKQGQVILKRAFSNRKWHDTYYVYDDYGNQTFVIPPEVQTYSSIWQQGNYSSVSLSDYNPFTTPMHENDGRYGGMYLSSYNKSIGLYFSAYNLTNPLTCKSFLSFDASLLGAGADFISGSVTGHVYYTTEDGVRHSNSLDGYFIANTIYLWGLPTEPVTRLYFNANRVVGEVRNDQPIMTEQLDDLMYQYRYDYRNRLVEKKIPGKDWEYIAYDNLDRPVLTADGNLRDNNQALKTEYDAFDRVTKTGLVNGVSTSSHSSFATHSNDNINTLLSENYYDRYDFDQQGLSLPSTAVQGIQTQGLQTGARVNILGTSQFVTTLLGYDDKGRLIYSGNHNPTTGVTESQTHTLDFVGRTTQTTTNHQKQGQSAITIVDDYTYDHAGRLTQHNQTLNGNQETLVQNTYDELGQLEQKTLGGGLQTVDYRYNVRGWLRHINDVDALGEEDLFGFEIDYGWLYNGNISKTYWATANDHVQHRYTYYYDGLDRLTSAYHYAPGMGWGTYNVNGIQYDRNGNLKRLIRRGFEGVGIDYLDYSYQGNQLQSVTDDYAHSEGLHDRHTDGNDYAYDPNGNLTEDKNKGITNIDYNHLNLPESITVDNESHNGEIVYLYDASGTKLKKTVDDQTTTYTPSVVYKNDQAAFIATPEGYIDMQHSPPVYVYQYRDHLGNNRLSYADTNGNGSIDTPYNSGVTVWEDGFEDKSTENGDWESDGAKYGGDITGFDSSFSHTGIKSGYITIDTDGQYASYYVHSNEWIAIDISEPTLYRFSGWVYAEPSLLRTRMAMFMNTEEETTYYTAVSEHMEYQKGEWVYVEKVAMVQPEIKKLNFRIDVDSVNDGTAWFDDLKIERLGSHNEIVSETNYYPFGMVHKGYNELVWFMA